MSIQFFAPRGPDNELMKLPKTYRRSVSWLPQIGDIFPEFSVETTQGKMNFWDWAEGKWTYLFSHPAAFTPVCTTEIAALAGMHSDFEASNTQLMAITGSTIDEQKRWHGEIEDLFNVKVNFPCVADTQGALARCFGMMHPKESDDFMIRKSFVVGPEMKIRMIFEYPLFIGRSSEEILRVIKALQMRSETGAATPADWASGDSVILDEETPESYVRQVFGTGSDHIRPYLRVVYEPRG